MVAVSIVTYHTDDSELCKCISSLPLDYISEITVVDNSRNSATAALCQKLSEDSGLKISYVENENSGFGAGHNIAMRRSLESDVPYHLVLNSDVSFNPEDFGKLVERMDGDQSIGALQPRIVNPDGSDQFTVRMLPTPLDLILRRFVPKRLFSRRRNRYELRHLDHEKEFNVPYHQGSFMLLRIDALRKVGLFDERFFMYPEDIDLTRRIHQYFQTLYTPIVKVVHDHRASSYRSLKMLRIHIVNMIRYFNKWGWFNDPERRRINRML